MSFVMKEWESIEILQIYDSYARIQVAPWSEGGCTLAREKWTLWPGITFRFVFFDTTTPLIVCFFILYSWYFYGFRGQCGRDSEQCSGWISNLRINLKPVPMMLFLSWADWQSPTVTWCPIQLSLPLRRTSRDIQMGRATVCVFWAIFAHICDNGRLRSLHCSTRIVSSIVIQCGV
jgi:hypothetical protein